MCGKVAGGVLLIEYLSRYLRNAGPKEVNLNFKEVNLDFADSEMGGFGLA